MTIYKNLRQIRYNKKTNTGEQERLRYEWYFFILNTSTEIDRIQERILQELSVCDDLTTTKTGIIVPKNSLAAKLITFRSERGIITDYNKIYRSIKFHKDRNLHPMNDVGLIKYAQKFIPS